MKLTEKDIEMFRSLSRSGLAKDIIDYLTRLGDNICDSRNWEKDDTKESTRRAADYVKRYFRDKLSLQDPSKNDMKYEWE